jgi:hypothetical protein
MKTTILIIAAAIPTLLANCSSTGDSSAHGQHESMPGMTAEEHAKMKQR